MISIEKMPTAVTADNHPIHNWFNFVAGYAPEYVEKVIEEYEEKNNKKPMMIYDPFAGCATTGVVSNKMGIKSIGVERNPFFYRIGYTKVHAKEALEFLDVVKDDFINISVSLPDLKLIETLEPSAKEYLRKLYDDNSLAILLFLRNSVNKYQDMKFYMGFTFLSKMMEFVTTAKTDGIYKVPTSTKKAISIEEAIKKTYSIFALSNKSTPDDVGQIVFASSVGYELEKESCDLVIFSPPYLNNFDFAEMTRMQLYFWDDASSWAEISEKHRNHMLVNTTTALKLVNKKEKQQELRNSLPDVLLNKIDPIVKQLEDIRKENSKKKTYNLIMYPYLAQMQEVLVRCYQGLRNYGEIHIVVSDAAFYGIHIDTQEYLCDILKEIGFEEVEYIRMRDRGDRWILDKRKSSGKQLGEFEVIGKKVV